MSFLFQSFQRPHDINKMHLNPHNIIPESNARGLFTGQMLDSMSLNNYRQPQVQRPGSSCSIGSNSSEMTVLPPIHNKNYQESRYKTELCRHWQESGTCPHGLQCLFAHGLNELKPFRGRHRKYKTQLCKAFHSDGFCSFGPRCSYIHSGIDIIPGAIRPFPFEQYQRKLSTDSMDSTLDFPSEQLEERLKMLSMGLPSLPTEAVGSPPVAKSPPGVRLSVFAKICHN